MDHLRRAVISTMYALSILIGLSSCGTDWRNWKIVHDEAGFQIRTNSDNQEWIYLKKNRNAKPDEFQKVTGPFKGNPPEEVQIFIWDVEYLDSVFGNIDRLQYLKTNVCINQRQEQGIDFSDIHIFNDRGDILATYTLQGTAEKMRLNRPDRHGLIIANNEKDRNWLLFDLLTGKSIGPSGMAIPMDIPNSNIRELEFMDDKITIIEQKPEQVLIHVLNSKGNILQRFAITGEYKSAVHNPINKKLMITEIAQETYAELIDLGQLKVIHIGGNLDSRNSIPGTLTQLQYHQVEHKERWTYATYEQNNDLFSIRILNEKGEILKTHGFNGQIKMAQVIGKQGDRIIYVLDKIDNTDFMLLDLGNGDLINVLTLPGKYKSIHEDVDHLHTQVATDRGGSILRQEMALY